MAIGPGKYGARAEQLLREVQARMVVVITVEGVDGGAFDVATDDPVLLAQLPEILRSTADRIAADLRQQRES